MPRFISSRPGMELSLPYAERPHRVTLIRRVDYEVLINLEGTGEQDVTALGGKALTLNVSEGGMLLLVGSAVDVGAPVILDTQAFDDIMPEAGSLAEVAWTFPLFLAPHLHLVGVRFLL